MQIQLDSIINAISQAIQYEDISPIVFHKIEQDIEKYY